MRSYLLLFYITAFICFFSSNLHAQIWHISDSVGTDGDTFTLNCANASSEQETTIFIYDSGGPDGDYGSNESFNKQIQVEEGKVIHIKFTEFNLASGSMMSIFNDNYLFAINATDSSLSGMEFSSDMTLTLSWQSLALTGSGFSAKIWCSDNPQNFTTTIETNLTPVIFYNITYYDICSGDELDFTATNTFSETRQYEQNNESLIYNWAIINNNDTIWFYDAGQNLTHTFESGGIYKVLCKANDENDGHNTNDNTVFVRVSARPTFNITGHQDTLCIGTEMELSASPHSEPIGNIPIPQILSHNSPQPFGVWILYTEKSTRDYYKAQYSGTIHVSGFDDTCHINSIDDIDRIYVNMSHSALVDVNMMIKCPNDQKCLIKSPAPSSWQWTNTGGINNPNSTNGGFYCLGEPTFAEDAYAPCYGTPGNGYSYYFTPTATNPFGGDYANDDCQTCTTTSFIDNCGIERTCSILDEGNYATYESMSSLIGCPINGEWTLYAYDGLRQDYGHVFEWGIYFNAPFSNSYQEGEISWTGEYISDTSATATSIIPNVTESGSYPYTFQLTDNFGCTYDTTLNIYINALETPQIDQIVTDSLNHNYITWTAIDNDEIQEYRIYRSSDTTSYDLVATIPANEPTEWTDETTEISVPYRYCITAFGGCETPMSQYVESMHFTTTISTNVPQTTSEGKIYANICQGQSITFTASNTFHDNGTYEHSDESLTYDWTIITGRYDTIVLPDAGMQISRTFDTSGGFRVKCQTRDTFNIANSNDNTINVQVSISPQFELTVSPDSICSGTEITLHGIVHQPQWQSQIPTNNSYSGTDLIPDNGGTQNYSSSIEIYAQDTSATINSTDQIDHVYINMEHSYLGDLSIMLECPNGQKCLLKAYSSGMPTPMDWSLTGGIHLNGSLGGGSLHLGLSPDPSSSTNPCFWTPGEGWAYSIYPDGTIPLGPSSPYHIISYTDDCNNRENIQVIDAAPQDGQYGPYESMSSLIGCPVNGTWKLHVNDKLQNDNGYIFGWGIYLDETEDEWSFMNSYEIEGFSWSGNGVTTDTTDNGAAIAIPSTTTTGQQEYTFTCTDNFGCSYSTAINAYVYRTPPVPEIRSASTNILNQNVIDFFYINGEDISQYNIYRVFDYGDFTSYILAATLPRTETIWTDMGSNHLQACSYAVTTNGFCGESEMSIIHRTMHLDLERVENGTVNLNWTHYEGFQYDTYKIYRGENPFAMEMIGEIPSCQNSFTDNNTNENSYYQIEISNSEDSNIIAKSNIEQSRQNSIDSYEITDFCVFPNPASTTLNITSSEILSSIEVFSATGQSVLQMNVNGDNTICDIKHLASGIYLIVAHDNNGKIAMTKFTKE